MIKVLYLFRTPRKFTKPDTFLYGANHWPQKYQVDYLPKKNTLITKIVNFISLPLSKIWSKNFGTGIQFLQILFYFPKIHQADIVIAQSDSVVFAVGLLKRLRLIKAKTIAITTVGYLSGFHPKKFFKSIATYCVKSIDHFFTHSFIDQKKIKEIYPDSQPIVIPPGSDNIFYHQLKQSKKNYLVAAGLSSHHDWKFLNQIAIAAPETEWRWLLNPKHLTFIPSSNVKVFKNLKPNQYRRQLQQAKALILAVKHKNQAEGQLTITDALLCHAPIIIPNISAMSSLGLTSKQTVFYKFKDVIDCCYKIKKLKPQPKAYRFAQTHLTTKKFTQNILKHIQ